MAITRLADTNTVFATVMSGGLAFAWFAQAWPVPTIKMVSPWSPALALFGLTLVMLSGVMIALVSAKPAESIEGALPSWLSTSTS